MCQPESVDAPKMELTRGVARVTAVLAWPEKQDRPRVSQRRRSKDVSHERVTFRSRRTSACGTKLGATRSLDHRAIRSATG
jgi:hypothetical protein